MLILDTNSSDFYSTSRLSLESHVQVLKLFIKKDSFHLKMNKGVYSEPAMNDHVLK